MDKELLVKALQAARDCYREMDRDALYNEAGSYREGQVGLIFALFELPFIQELETLVNKTITTDNYIKGAVERIDVLVADSKRSHVNQLAERLRDQLDHVATAADALLGLTAGSDVLGMGVKLAVIDNELRHVNASREALSRLIEDL